MAFVKPAAWVDTDAYSVGDRVSYLGIGYECVTAVAADSNGNAIPVDNDSWKVYAVFYVDNHAYSVYEAIKFEINSEDDRVDASIPLFVQAAEYILSDEIRSPAQITTRVLDVEEGSKVRITDIGLLEFEHVRTDTDSRSSYDLVNRGSVVIKGTNRETFEQTRQYYNGTNYADFIPHAVTYPVYRFDKEFLYIAPDFDTGEKIAITFYEEVPELLSNILLTNDDYEPINSDGDTLDEWVSDGNAASDFVQADSDVFRNLWTATCRHLLKAYACYQMCLAINDPQRTQYWQQQFAILLAAKKKENNNLKANRTITPIQNTIWNG